ncbi:MAG: lipopolysaccharide heptosyltransferase I [Deltaproteobacteria bacterium]|nr:lipopolysaccharide heptosyltransferase I [Deltaproteobacteria bacterium]
MLDLSNKKILIVKPSSLGDIIHTLPVLHNLKKSAPSSHIHWLIDEDFKNILEAHPLITKLWFFKKEAWKKPSQLLKTSREVLALRKNLIQEKFDVVIDIQGLLRSALFTYLTKSKIRIGFLDAREKLSALFYNIKITGGKPIHAVERYLKLLSPLGINKYEIEFPLPAPKNTFKKTCPYYVVVPGARWATKRWPSYYFIELIKKINKKAIIIGSSQDREIAQKICHAVPEFTLDLSDQTSLQDLISIIKQAQFVIGNDTGPIHIAAALKIPVYALFGSTNPLRTGPYGHSDKVFNISLPCAPCFKKTCYQKGNQHLSCLKQLTPQDVYQKIINIL